LKLSVLETASKALLLAVSVGLLACESVELLNANSYEVKDMG